VRVVVALSTSFLRQAGVRPDSSIDPRARIRELERRLRRVEASARVEARQSKLALEEELRQVRATARSKQTTARRENAQLSEELRSARKQLRAETRRAKREAARAMKLEQELKVAQRRIEELKEKLDLAQRARRRQAAPFSKGDPKPDPKKPGRKRGSKYGRRGERARPTKVDKVLEAQLPTECPGCGGVVVETGVHEQFVTDVPPVAAHTTQFNVHVGCCQGCGQRVQGRHPQQHSDALGAAANQIGPTAQALAAHLNKVVGASYVKIADFFLAAWGIGIAPSTLTRALKRLAKKGDPAYQEIAEAVRTSPVVYPDETGWKVGGLKSWLWAFVGKDATLYAIEFSRGFEVAKAILGADWAGVLNHDGWTPYDSFCDALHQQCLGHLIRRCALILETATQGAVRFPRAIKAILQDALALRDRHAAGEISDHGLLSAVGKLEQRVERELSRTFSYKPNRVFAAHLRKHKHELFTFLRLRVTLELEVEATNWPAEQAIRPAVINRKTSGGNRSKGGAKTQAVLMSLFRTCKQRGIDSTKFFVEVLRATDPQQHAEAALGP